MGKILVAAAAGALTIATGGTFLGFTGLTAGLLSAASSLVLSGLSSALAGKPKTADLSAIGSVKSGGVTRQVRQAITPRRMIYGEIRSSGPYAFIGSTNTNQYLHFIIMLASHEVEEVGEIWVNDVSVTSDMIDGNGDVISGKYSGLMRVKKYTGTDIQAAEPTMVSAFPEWTANHKLSGIAYIYVRLIYNRDVWAGGIPNISAWTRGKKLFDPRLGTNNWHHNPILITNDYLTDTRLGVGTDQAIVDSAFLTSGANTCEEMVTTAGVTATIGAVTAATDILSHSGDTLLFQRGDRVTIASTGTIPAGLSAATNYFVIPYQRTGAPRFKLASSYDNSLTGTAIDITSAGSGVITVIKNAEPRYSAGGTVDVDAQPQEILNNILSSMAGKAVYSGGKWRILTGRYETPTIAFDEDDLAGPIIVKTKTSRADRFNRVYGTYVSPLNNAQPSDYPFVKNDTYYAQDNNEWIDRSLPLVFTQRAHTGQRIAKIALEKNRQEIIFQARFKLSAFKVQVGDNVFMNFDRYGWSNKVFEVIEWALQIDDQGGVPIPFIEMKLKETASACYDWNSGEETAVDPAPNTTLPDVFNISAVTGLSFDSFQIDTLEGDKIYRLILGWDMHPDTFVIEGGQFEIQYKLNADLDWRPSFFVDGALTSSEVTTASAGVEYDLRIRAVNNIGVRSPWNYLNDVVTGTGGGVTASEDWGNFTDIPTSPPALTEDWGDYAAGATTGDEDYGAFA